MLKDFLNQEEETVKNGKPQIKIDTQKKDIYLLISATEKALKKIGKKKEAFAMYKRVKAQGEKYDKALEIVKEYVEVVEKDE